MGHWFGLFHTFQDQSCDSDGDLVDDTPPESTWAFGCPIGRDSCPDSNGEDPVTNFMNYSDDSCMNEFTPGQKVRIDEMFAAWREGN